MTTLLRVTRVAAFSAAVMCTTVQAQTRSIPLPGSASFAPLGIPAGHDEAYAFGISPDGTTAVGWARTPGFEVQAVAWRNGTSPELLDSPGPGNCQAIAASADGSTIVGGADQFPFGSTPGATRWRSGLSPQFLPGHAGFTQAWAITPDASVIVGDGGVTAFRWTEGGGFQDLGALPGETYSRAFSTSADGNTIVGECGSKAFRWTPSSGMQQLPLISGGAYNRAQAQSADGHVATGQAGDASFQNHAVRWVDGGAPQRVDFPGGEYGDAWAINADGTVIGGTASPAGGSAVAFLWTESGGAVNLNTLFPSLGLDLGGMILTEVRSLSADGLSMVGVGYAPQPNGSYVMQPWIATIPAPSGVALIAFAGVVVSRRRR